MKQLNFHYHLKLNFDNPITDHRFTLRFFPVSDARQKTLQLQRDVRPGDDLSRSSDQWGNTILFGGCKAAHTALEADLTGKVITGLSLGQPSESVGRDGVFKYNTALTAADQELRAFSDDLRTAEDVRETAEEAMQKIYRTMTYMPGSTDVKTSAAQAFVRRSGVCQDYAHIMLSVMRQRGIPARYVAGMLLGEGESHAWTEVLYRGIWYAFDPTNCEIVADKHIKMSHGRDAGDCAINRGIFRGIAAQTTDISVIVSEEELEKIPER